MTSWSLIRQSLVQLGLAVLLVGCATSESDDERQRPSLVLVGGAPMAAQAGEEAMGWGQSLPAHLSGSIVLDNRALSGHSSESFLREGFWQAALERLRPGDFAVIGFGHGDQHEDDPSRYAAAWTDYRTNLERMVDESLAAGARPLLVTPLYRPVFRADGQPEATLGGYPEVTRAVAVERQVPLVDLNVMSRRLLVEAGREGATRYYQAPKPFDEAGASGSRSDDIRLTPEGAALVARLFAKVVGRQSLPLADYLVD